MRGKKHNKDEKDTEDLSNSQQNEDLLQPMAHPVLSKNSFNRSPVGKRGSLLFSVILEPSDSESEKENVVEDVKEENVEVTIFEKYFCQIFLREIFEKLM